jgi:hypothetical protein
MMASAFERLGFTRDSATWVWAQVLGIATLVAANAGDLPVWFAYIGLHVTDIDVHRLSVLAAVLLYVGGRYATSPLPGKPAA